MSVAAFKALQAEINGLKLALDIVRSVLTEDERKWGAKMRHDHRYALVTVNNALDGNGPPCPTCLQQRGAGKLLGRDKKTLVPCRTCVKWVKDQAGGA